MVSVHLRASGTGTLAPHHHINCHLWPPLGIMKCKICSLESLSWWSRPALRHSSDIFESVQSWQLFRLWWTWHIKMSVIKRGIYRRSVVHTWCLSYISSWPDAQMPVVLSCDLTSVSCCVGGRGRSVWSKSCRKMRRVFDSMLRWMLYWCWCRWSQCHQGISCGWQGI